MKGFRFVVSAPMPIGSENGKDRMLMPSRWLLGIVLAAVLASANSAFAQQTIRVGWTIPAEESKYWMMRRPAEFPDLGKTYNIEWTQFQGTAPMTQALAAGALRRRHCRWPTAWSEVT